MRTITINEKDNVFFLSIWEERTHLCQCGCNRPLGEEPKKYMFHHILEKRSKTKMKHSDYSRFRYCTWNIMLLHWDCHTSYERNPKKRPLIDKQRELLIAMITHPTFRYNEKDCAIGPVPKDEDPTMIQSLFPNQQLKLD
jgi:hypothetical protein